MKIERKKTGNVVTLIISSLALLIFFIVSIVGLFSDKTIKVKLGFLFFLGISAIGLYSTITPIKKVLSNNPEFELAERYFLIFNNPYFDKIPYNEMVGCNLYHPPRTTLIGISLKHSSNIKSNSNKFQKLLLGVPKDKSNIVFLSLDFADIEPHELVRLITDKIAQFNGTGGG